jgi:26S proteasome non-ATPase regulatory subunit 9
MDDIHAPTVSSGPTSGGYTNGVPKEQLSLQELIAERDRVETELKALGQVLDSVRPSYQANDCWLIIAVQHGVNMNTGLTTFDGFPRSDIDVPQSTLHHIRQTRNHP